MTGDDSNDIFVYGSLSSLFVANDYADLDRGGEVRGSFISSGLTRTTGRRYRITTEVSREKDI
ncbi:hypothetical protein SBA2_360054 [Acidobacteriia bacterium SbA2]|nr:hypothetical protein SBA2_360054 [Acidobacteriia bacterium SbA2]